MVSSSHHFASMTDLHASAASMARTTSSRFALATRLGREYESHAMLLDRLQARAQAPHIQAFSISAEDLLILRTGLRAALEQGDLAPLRAFWDARSPPHVQRATQRRWRVPGATISRVSGALTAKAATLLDDAPLLRERLLHSLAELHTRGRGQEHVDVAPEPWFVFEASSSSLMLRGTGSEWLASYDAERCVEAIDQLFSSPEPPHRRGPVGDLRWVRDVRFFLEDSRREVAWDRIENPMRDTARYPQPRGSGALVDGTPYGAAIDVEALVDFDSIVALAVGPYVESRGPGIYVARPAGEPLIESRSTLLPLFRIDVPIPGAKWQILREDRLLEAAGVVRSTRFPVRWWETGDEELSYGKDETWRGEPSKELELFAWRHLDEVADDHVFFCDRFADLLEESVRANRAVIVARHFPDDQGELRPPATRAWGWPVSVQERLRHG